jgi:predicted HicB family RNase H-like nuclease
MVPERPSLHLRLPRDLHERVRQLADEQDVSLNTLLVALIAGSVGFKLAGDADR